MISVVLLMSVIFSTTAFAWDFKQKGNNVPGDVNHDCIVDMKDIEMLAEHYGRFRGEKKYRGWADINKDGLVDIRDIVVSAWHYGKTCKRTNRMK